VKENKRIRFKNLFNAFFPALFSFTQQLVRDRETARDITQEAFLRTYSKWEIFEFTDAIKAFLYVTAKNLCLDHFKKNKTIQNFQSSQRQETIIEENFLFELTRQETFRLLYKAIRELPAHPQRVILLSLRGHSNAEISEIMGISVNTVKTHKKNAYRILKEKMSDAYYVLPIIAMLS
jgi:RNA polymerase sigma-70 factor (family 1)